MQEQAILKAAQPYNGAAHDMGQQLYQPVSTNCSMTRQDCVMPVIKCCFPAQGM